jgi:magnesium-transporting ATPase (P-type)
MKSNTQFVLRTLHIFSWCIYVGLLIKTGALAYSTLVNLFSESLVSHDLYLGLTLSKLLNFSKPGYVGLSFLLVILTGLKAHIFHLVIKIFEKINFATPFSLTVSRLISRISYVALTIVLLTWAGAGYAEWLTAQGVDLPGLEDYLGGGDEFLLLSGIIFMIAQVFKRGIEIQSENELTV